MRNLLANFFFFNKRERQGIYILILIILLVASSNFVFPLLTQNNEFRSEVRSSMIFQYDSILNSVNQTQDSVTLFNFDPNELSLEAWLKLGLKSGQAQVVLNYLDKGGSFTRKEDLRKIYSINDKIYAKLEPYIKIKQISTQKTGNRSKITAYNPLDPNTADSSDLIKIHGIGPVFASRIIKYRNLLGGFHSVSQLQEVYGIDSLKFHSIKSSFKSCDLKQIHQLNLNTASFKELLKHPYISYDFTKDIVNRRKKEVFKNAADAFNIQFISDSTFKKLLPYLITK
jgi:competence protein ComEA